MKRKLKDPKKMGEKKEQIVNNGGKNQETTTVYQICKNSLLYLITILCTCWTL